VGELTPSETARRVASYRLGYQRLETPFGNPGAEDSLMRDVAAGTAPPSGAVMSGYLEARTAFFDRVVVNSLGRNVSQVVNVGAGYDGRSLRYAKDGVRWWEVDRPASQADKRLRLERLGIAAQGVTFVAHDLSDADLAGKLVAEGFEPDAGSLFICEGVAVYMSLETLTSVFAELRALTTVGSRFAVSLRPSSAQPSDAQRQFEAAVAAMGEPALSWVTPETSSEILAATRWRAVELSERASRAGFTVLAPEWAPADDHQVPTRSSAGRFWETMLHRSEPGTLKAHLQSTYGIAIKAMRELDLAVYRADLVGGGAWVARLFPSCRDRGSVVADATVLGWLGGCGIRARPLLLACWQFSTGRSPLSEAARWWINERDRIDRSAPIVTAALAGESDPD
jgi:methyltransferase (TIGR00027 family)